MNAAAWQQRFEEYQQRKVDEALAAELPRYVTAFKGPRGEREAVGSEWTKALFDGDFLVSPVTGDTLPGCSLVLVRSRAGNTVAANPSTLGGGETDAHLVYEGLSRVAADAVLAGAKTVRGAAVIFSVWHPELVRLRVALGKSRHPIQVVATERGLALDQELLFNLPSLRVILLTGATGAARMQTALAERPWVETCVLHSSDDLAGGFARLRAGGVDRLSCVGGRTLALQLLDLGLVQDLYLTTGTSLGGAPDTPVAHPSIGTVVVRKRGTGVEEGVLFEHLDIAPQLTNWR